MNADSSAARVLIVNTILILGMGKEGTYRTTLCRLHDYHFTMDTDTHHVAYSSRISFLLDDSI